MFLSSVRVFFFFSQLPSLMPLQACAQSMSLADHGEEPSVAQVSQARLYQKQPENPGLSEVLASREEGEDAGDPCRVQMELPRHIPGALLIRGRHDMAC